MLSPLERHVADDFFSQNDMNQKKLGEYGTTCTYLFRLESITSQVQ